MMPAGEPMEMQIVFVSADGSVSDGPRLVIPGTGVLPLGRNSR
jgi:hypothetical protein